MTVEIPQNEVIFGRGRKEVGSSIRWRRANRGSVNIKKRERGGAV